MTDPSSDKPIDIEAILASLGEALDDPGDCEWGTASIPAYTRDTCPRAPHRGPEGPNEDVSQCPLCWSLSWELRPEGETFGEHPAGLLAAAPTRVVLPAGRVRTSSVAQDPRVLAGWIGCVGCGS